MKRKYRPESFYLLYWKICKCNGNDEKVNCNYFLLIRLKQFNMATLYLSLKKKKIIHSQLLERMKIANIIYLICSWFFRISFYIAIFAVKNISVYYIWKHTFKIACYVSTQYGDAFQSVIIFFFSKIRVQRCWISRQRAVILLSPLRT